MEIGAESAAIVIPVSVELPGVPDVNPEASKANADNTSVPADDKSNQNRSNPTWRAQSVGGMVKCESINQTYDSPDAVGLIP